MKILGLPIPASVVNAVEFDLRHLDRETIKIYLNYIKNRIRFRNQADFASEIISWERYYHQYQVLHPTSPKLGRYDKTDKSILYALGHLNNECIKCIEVGSGPVSQFYTNYFLDKPNISIITIDPLAEFYKAIHKKYFMDYNIECIAGYGETLHEDFPANSFDIVYSRNAIDHSQSPADFVKDLYHILKPGGYLILYGFVREGSNQSWFGLHQWDIEVENDDLLLTNRNKSVHKYNMTQDMQLVSKNIDASNEYGKDSYSMIYTKN